MFKTNSDKFCPHKKNYLKVFFSISSDKAVLPQSLLGISKYFMEQKLSKFAKINRSCFVSSVRFANVCFSEGSYLKYVKERIEKKLPFGLPLNVKRFFITHDEAISLCLKSVLKKNKNMILMPSNKLLNKDFTLAFLAKKIASVYGYKLKYTNKFTKIKNRVYPVIISNKNLVGQKNYEEFFDKKNDTIIYDKDLKTMKIKLNSKINVSSIIKDIQHKKNKLEIIKIIKKKIKTFNPQKKSIKVSHLI